MKRSNQIWKNTIKFYLPLVTCNNF